MTRKSLFTGIIFTGLLLGVNIRAATTIISDNYNLANVGSDFALGNGVNSGVNPPTTRLTGTTASGLRYIKTAGAKVDSAHLISANKFQVNRIASDSSTISLFGQWHGPGALVICRIGANHAQAEDGCDFVSVSGLKTDGRFLLVFK
jgi:hypothetical protein